MRKPAGPRVNAASPAASEDSSNDDQFDLLSGLDELFSSGGEIPLFWSPQLTSEQSAIDAANSEAGGLNPPFAATEAPKSVHPTSAASSKPKRKNSTQRQKEEMQFLRSKVEELESQLRTLKRRRGNESPESREWEEVAKRQLTARSKAEDEQRNLQSVLKNQIKVARGIEKLLGDPMVWDQLQEENWREANPPHKEDMEIFCEMLRDIDARHHEVDLHLGFAKSMRGDSDSEDMFELKSASADGLCFETRWAKLSPFDYQTVDQVAWEAVRQGSFSSSDDHITVVMASNEFVLSKLRATAPPFIQEPTTAYQAVKRFPGDNCGRIVSEFSAVVPGSPESNVPPFRMVSRSWGRLRPIKMENGQIGSVMEERLLTNVTLLKPTTPVEKKTKHCEIDILVRLLVSIYKEKQALMRQVIENKLIDAVIAARSGQAS